VASKAAILHVAADFATACTAALKTKELLGTNAVTAGAPAAATSASKHGAFMLLCDLDHRKTLFREPQRPLAPKTEPVCKKKTHFLSLQHVRTAAHPDCDGQQHLRACMM
jgi:hypothetical protein